MTPRGVAYRSFDLTEMSAESAVDDLTGAPLYLRVNCTARLA